MNTPMLNELNTIVQFLAALYVTITIDNLVIRRFWTPDLYKIVKSTLSKFEKEGSRSRSVLKNFLGDAKLKSLQSDGYEGLSSAEIYKRRNDASTEAIVKKLRAIVLDVKARMACAPEQVSDLLKRAANYLDKFWNQVFAYRKDGDYTIDNMLAERAIRPITGQRKNSLFFCSRGGAEKSCLINTFVETCKQHGVSFRNFIRELMLADIAGEKDYDALLSRLLMVKK